MARNLGSTELTGNEWEVLFDSAVDGSARELVIRNLSTSANAVELFVTPNDGEEAPDDPTVRYSLQPGEVETVAGISASGGVVGKVYVRSAGATVAHRVKIR